MPLAAGTPAAGQASAGPVLSNSVSRSSVVIPLPPSPPLAPRHHETIPPMRLTFLAAVLIGAAIAIGACRRAPAEQAPRRPNILFILLDDLRWDALGYAGHPYVKTPQIDRIANEGVNFKNAFCTTSLCSPSRASLLTGVYAHKHGVTNNLRAPCTARPIFPRRSIRPAMTRRMSASGTWARATTSRGRASITS